MRIHSLALLSIAIINSSSAPCLRGQLLGTTASPYGVIIAKSSGQTQSTLVDAKAAFQLCNLPDDAQAVDIFLYQGVGTDTLFLGTVIPSQKEIAQFPVPAPLRANMLGHFICPKCHQADRTARIINNIAPRVRTVALAGDTSYSPIIGRKMYDDCVGGGSRGFCSRDNIRF